MTNVREVKFRDSTVVEDLRRLADELEADPEENFYTGVVVLSSKSDATIRASKIGEILYTSEYMGIMSFASAALFREDAS